MRRVVLIVLFTFLLLPHVPHVRAMSTLTIQPGSYETITWRTSSKDYMGLYGHFVITNGTDITFFICNESAFNNWTEGQDIEAYEILKDVTSGDYEFLSYGSRSSSIRWYLVFDNTDSAYTTQTVDVDHQIDLTAPTIECNVNDNDVLSGTWEFNITGVDRFGIDSIESTIYASSYPNSFEPFRQNAYHIEGSSSIFILDTSQMENGSYYITIKVTDVCDNEQSRTIHFKVENVESEIIEPLANPWVVGFSIFGIISLAAVWRRRSSLQGIKGKMKIRIADLAAELRRRNSLQGFKDGTRVGSRKEPADPRVVCGIVGTLALFSPILLIFQSHAFGTDVLMRAVTYHTYPPYGFEFMNPYLLIADFPLTVWRLVFVYQMVRYYEGRSSRRMTVIMGIVAENLYVIWNFMMLYVILPGYWGSIYAIPTPLMLFSALVFMWFTPFPVPKSAFDDHAEPEKWWKENTDAENRTRAEV